MQIAEFLNVFSSNLQKNMPLTTEYSPTNIPPSSLHSFRRILKNETESGTLPEVLLADFKAKFTNTLYHSVLDDHTNIDFSYRNITIDSNGTCEFNIFNDVIENYINSVWNYECLRVFYFQLYLPTHLWQTERWMRSTLKWKLPASQQFWHEHCTKESQEKLLLAIFLRQRIW